MNKPIKIAYIVLRYPTLSQVFIQREIAGLCSNGLEVEIHPCLSFGRVNPLDANPKVIYPNKVDVFRFPILLLIEIARDPLRALKLLKVFVQNLPKNIEGWLLTFAGVFCAIVKAPYFRKNDVCLFHGAWATAPATAAALLSCLCRRPFSFGGHAYDIYRNGGDSFLDAKLKYASFVHTTTSENVAYLTGRCADTSKILLIRRGLAQLLPIRTRVSKATDPVKILSVGRLVSKKGHVYQLKACHLLKEQGIPFRLKIVGDGPLWAELNALVNQLRLQSEVQFCGSLDSECVEELYDWADVFWHTGVVDREGDRDGLPNVVPEAFSHGVPVVASSLPGILEAVKHEETGLVVDPENIPSLASAVKRLISDPELRKQLTFRGRAWVETNFLAEKNSSQLAQAICKTIPDAGNSTLLSDAL